MAQGVSPIDGYAQSDTDTTSASPQYYGFLTPNGAYYISQATTTGGVMSFRYYASSTLTQYQIDWTNRAGLSYDYYCNVFTNT